MKFRFYSIRPLLLILDRQSDLHTMLYHSWTYLSLINDIFAVKNNQFVYTAAADTTDNK